MLGGPAVVTFLLVLLRPVASHEDGNARTNDEIDASRAGHVCGHEVGSDSPVGTEVDYDGLMKELESFSTQLTGFQKHVNSDEFVNMLQASPFEVNTAERVVELVGFDLIVMSLEGREKYTNAAVGNVVVGNGHFYKKASNSLISGSMNQAYGDGHVVFGSKSVARGELSVLLAGMANLALGGRRNSVLGGVGNIASGGGSSVAGGQNNTAWRAAAAGGAHNSASGLGAVVAGGMCSVTGGFENMAAGRTSTWSGGGGGVSNTADGLLDVQVPTGPQQRSPGRQWWCYDILPEGTNVWIIDDATELRRLCERTAPGARQKASFVDAMLAFVGQQVVVVGNTEAGYRLEESGGDRFVFPCDAIHVFDVLPPPQRCPGRRWWCYDILPKGTTVWIIDDASELRRLCRRTAPGARQKANFVDAMLAFVGQQVVVVRHTTAGYRLRLGREVYVFPCDAIHVEAA